MELSSRTLVQPTILFADEEKLTIGQGDINAKATWDLRNVKYISPKECKTLYIIRITEVGMFPPSLSDVLRLAQHLMTACQKSGIRGTVNKPMAKDVAAAKGADPIRRRRQFGDSLTTMHNHFNRPPIVLVALASEDANVFSDVKYWADCLAGVKTVCIRPKAVRQDLKARSKNGDGRLLGNVW